jgi:excisionase family DNA binding protein
MVSRPPDTEQPEWLTVKEVAARLRVSTMTVHRAIDAGHIPAVRFGERTFRINAARFETYLNDGGTR